MPRPTTRSLSAQFDCDFETINLTKDPIQITFNTDSLHLPDWRYVLNTRYVGKYRPHTITSVWKDFTSDNKQALDLPIILQSPLPDNLHNSFLQIHYNSKKLLTIRVYYTTGTILVQGHACQEWVDKEFNKLKLIVSAMTSNTQPAVSLLDCPSSPVQCPALLPCPNSDTEACSPKLPDSDSFSGPSSNVSKADSGTSDRPTGVISNCTASLGKRDRSEMNIITPPSSHISAPCLSSNKLSCSSAFVKTPPSLNQLSSLSTIYYLQKQLSATLKTVSVMESKIDSLETEIIILKKETQNISSATQDSKSQTKNAIKIFENNTSLQISDIQADQADLRHKMKIQSDQLSSFKDHQTKLATSLQQQIQQKSHQPSNVVPTPLLSEPPIISTHDKNSDVDKAVRAKSESHLTYAAAVKNSFAPLAPHDIQRPSPLSSQPITTNIKANKPASTPLDILTMKKLPLNCHTLILADSILSTINQHKLSQATGKTVANFTVPGLTVNHLHNWLKSSPPVPQIQRVVFHVGINSCSSGPVAVTTWRQIIAQHKRVFPNATVQASSIVPPRGFHPLKQSASASTRNLREACKTDHIHYIDHTPSFITQNGAPKKAMYRDAIHPSMRGAISLAFNIRHSEKSDISLTPTRLYSSNNPIDLDATCSYSRNVINHQNPQRNRSDFHSIHRSSPAAHNYAKIPATHQQRSCQYEDISSDEEDSKLSFSTRKTLAAAPRQQLPSDTKELIRMLLHNLESLY